MSSLPLVNSPEAARLGPNELSAYRVCLAFQEQATEKNLIIHARILGYLILHAPTANARHEIVKAIHSCNNDFKVLSKLGQSFIDYYIRPCKFSFSIKEDLRNNSHSVKKFKGRTPAPSDHPSRPSFDKDKKDIQAMIREAPKSHVEAKEQVSSSYFNYHSTNSSGCHVRIQALERDGFRCVVTGKYDLKASMNISEQEVIAAGGAVNTECAHIVPDSTYFDVSNTPTGSSVKVKCYMDYFTATTELILTQKEYSASVLAVLKRFGYNVESLNGPKVHSLFNVMTMERNVHDWFDRLDVWFEETVSVMLVSHILYVLIKCPETKKVANCYNVKTATDRLQAPKQVTFTSSDPTKYPDLPSPKLLALHAACAKVAHLSGADEHIDSLDHDMDHLGVLAFDGSSFAILNHALLNKATHYVGVVV
jgi:hypothetical protein